MKKRNNKRAVKSAMIDRFEMHQRFIDEIKSYYFINRLQIAWQILKGNKRGR